MGDADLPLPPLEDTGPGEDKSAHASLLSIQHQQAGHMGCRHPKPGADPLRSPPSRRHHGPAPGTARLRARVRKAAICARVTG